MSVETYAPRVVTAIITVKVSQGEEGSSTGWLTEMNKIVASFAGYITAVVIPRVPPLQDDWVSLLRFDTSEHLNAWVESDARRAVLKEVEPFVDHPKRTRSPIVGSQKTKVSNRAAIRDLTHTDIFPRTWLRDVVRLMLKL